MSVRAGAQPSGRRFASPRSAISSPAPPRASTPSPVPQASAASTSAALPLALPDAAAFSARVRERFARRADRYAEQARLQRGVAWRLAHLCRDLPLLPGPCLDLGAGTGLLSQALTQLLPDLSIRQLDLCPQLLARNPLARADGAALVWDLNLGLPPRLAPASLLVSSFALQWLEDPVAELQRWCLQLRSGGWLALALPTAGSLNGWHQAARAAAVPCTALPLPAAERLIAVAASGLELRRHQILRFTSSAADGRQALGRIDALGAGASRGPRLTPGQLRRLLAHWPQRPAWCWEVLLLLGRRP
ncbi:MAG: methyltransferase domain-containing protein [Cyanobium sp.]|jgi:malonyl-CoA O-methyltransferase